MSVIDEIFFGNEEFSNFCFHQEVCYPLDHITKKNRPPIIKDMLVRYLTQIVNSSAENIKSGLENAFSIFNLSTSYVETMKEISQIDQKCFICVIVSFQGCLNKFEYN
ncbi:hypothetical protein OTU49_005451 [Cherax quadricarinatus]|uniref:Mon2/Sec7/BIG1-like HDS domain-containing protein n=1 Tax=Cherax quadricarinatus TaxID=27406 RepID=A0AAW0X7P9_CHEQU